MSGLSRRAFLGSSAALASAFALPTQFLGDALAAPLQPAAGAPTTLLKTVKMGPVVKGQYRNLIDQPGEPFLVRTDLTRKLPAPGRIANRRSLAYLGHLSDIHIIDAQSPARLEPLIAISNGFVSALHPQDTLSTHVLSAMVQSIAKSRFSPVTGAPLTATVNTGDNADSRSSLELDWYITLIDGGDVTPNSGSPGTYQGVQVWEDATYAYHPDNPDIGPFGAYGFPKIPGLLQQAVSQQVTSPGVPTPWYTVFGNHDTLFMGNLRVDPTLEAWAIGSHKAATPRAATSNMLSQMSTDTSVAYQLFDQIQSQLGFEAGVFDVTENSARFLFEQIDFMQRHLDSPALPGPVGHGFTQANISSGQTYWSADITPYLRVFGLDTCNSVTGADGAVPQDQVSWLEAGLAQATKENKLCLVLSHHNSYTLENNAHSPIGPSQPLVHAEEFISILQGYPNMIAWVNGHTHLNAITAHPKPDNSGGFWEITTASCIDYPQQQQLIEIVDNKDGTLSLFCTTINHDSDAAWKEGDFSQDGMASLSRQLAANYWQIGPTSKVGSELDRNTELIIKAPFDTSQISEATVEQVHNARKAQILSYEKGMQL